MLTERQAMRRAKAIVVTYIQGSCTIPGDVSDEDAIEIGKAMMRLERQLSRGANKKYLREIEWGGGDD
jgi:hypothetical protein